MELKHSENWNKEDPVRINSIKFNQDNTLFTLATTKGFRIFTANSYFLIHPIRKEINEIGNISIANLLYKSSLIFFVGNETNNNWKQNSLIIWDDTQNLKIGEIKLKDKIMDFNLTKNVLSIFASNKIYIFELISFKLVKVIDGLNINNKLFTYNTYDMIAYTTFKNKTEINIKTINYNKNHKLETFYNRNFKVNFDNIQAIQISHSGQYIFVSSILGNKIHIYYVQNGNLRNCIYLGNTISAIDNIDFNYSKESKILFIKEMNKICLFSINENNLIPKCNCQKYNDNDLLNNTSKKNEGSGLMSMFKSYFKVFIFLLFYRNLLKLKRNYLLIF